MEQILTDGAIRVHTYENNKNLCIAPILKTTAGNRIYVTRFTLEDKGAQFLGEQPDSFYSIAKNIRDSTRKIAGCGKRFAYFVGRAGNISNVLFQVSHVGRLEVKNTIFSDVNYMGRGEDRDTCFMSFVSSVADNGPMYAIAQFNDERGLTICNDNLPGDTVNEVFYSDEFQGAICCNQKPFYSTDSKSLRELWQ